MENRLVAGPELDRMVHARVMGKEGEAPPYSTDIAVAWDLLKLLPRPKRMHADTSGVHHCMCGGPDQGAGEAMKPVVWERGDRFAFVLCLTALKAKEVGLIR